MFREVNYSVEYQVLSNILAYCERCVFVQYIEIHRYFVKVIVCYVFIDGCIFSVEYVLTFLTF